MSDGKTVQKDPNAAPDLGKLDVEFTREQLENDLWAQKTLREIGKAMPVLGHKYEGSIAIHYYVSDIAGKMATKHQFALGDISDAAVSTGVANISKELARIFGRPYKTTNKKDQR